MNAASKDRIEAARVKRHEMASIFAKTQKEMSEVVDDLTIIRRSAVPYQSSAIVFDVRNPIPEDAHLIPSKEVIVKHKMPNFVVESSTTSLHASGKPWASYERPMPDVMEGMPANTTKEPPPPPPGPPAPDEEMWRTQYLEWTLQKNAYNPDVAAQLRTNVRKQAALSMVDPALAIDPARTSENVKAALADSEVTGPAPPVVKPKLTLENVFPLPTMPP